MFNEDNDIYLINIDKLAYSLENNSNDYKCNFYMNNLESFNIYDFDNIKSVENIFKKAGKFILEQLKKLWNLIKRIGLFIWNLLKSFYNKIKTALNNTSKKLKNLENKQIEIKKKNVDLSKTKTKTVSIHDYVDKKDFGSLLTKIADINGEIDKLGDAYGQKNIENTKKLEQEINKLLKELNDTGELKNEYVNQIGKLAQDINLYGVSKIYEKLQHKISLNMLSDICRNYFQHLNIFAAADSSLAMDTQDSIKILYDVYGTIYDFFDIDDDTPFNTPEFNRELKHNFMRLFLNKTGNTKDELIDVELKEVATENNANLSIDIRAINESLKNIDLEIKKKAKSIDEINRILKMIDEGVENFIKKMESRKNKERVYVPLETDEPVVNKYLDTERHEMMYGDHLDDKTIIIYATGEINYYKSLLMLTSVTNNVLMCICERRVYLINIIIDDLNKIYDALLEEPEIVRELDSFFMKNKKVY